MRHIEVFLPDAFAEELVNLSPEEFDLLLDRTERLHFIIERREEAALRKHTAYYLLWAGSIILVVSLTLISLNAFNITRLPDNAVITLIGSVAVEFIGMLWMVVRYLFPQGIRDD